MRMILAAVVAIGLTWTGGASAARLTMPTVTGIQQADWYCGPRCQEHRHWHAQQWHQRQWHEGHYYNGYRSNYGYR